MIDLVKLGEIVKIARLESALDQKTLARLAGVSQSTISALERGGNSVSISTLGEIAEALEMPTWVLLLGADVE